MKKILALVLCVVMAVAMFAGMSVSATEASATDAIPALEGYWAFLSVQTNTSLWIFRNPYHDATYGYGKLDENGVHVFEALYDTTNKTHYAGTFTDAKLDGDGEYTISLVDPDFADEQYFSLMNVSTNIPVDAGITITNVKVKINNKTVYDDAAYIDPESKEYVCVLLQNAWNKDGWCDAFQIPEPCNTQSIEMTLTVSGFGYWAEGQEPVEEPADDVAPSATDAPADDAAEGGCTGAVAFPAVAAVIIAAALVIFKKRA